MSSLKSTAVLLCALLLSACGGGGGGGGASSSSPASASSASSLSSSTGSSSTSSSAASSTSSSVVGSSSSSAAPIAAGDTGLLNDTGSGGGYDAAGAYTSDCNSTIAGNDCRLGRDATANDSSDGRAGFSFTKLDASGRGLPANAATWNCVKDNVTGLIWENKTVSNGALSYTNKADGSVGDASQYVSSVNAASLCGANDWRMPTSGELQGLVDYGASSAGPFIDTTWFPNTQSSRYWSGTSSSGFESTLAWIVDFSSGYMTPESLRTSAYSVRLVRAGTAPSGARYSISADGQEVTDNRTGLIWRRCVEGMSWNGSTCAGTATDYARVAAFNRAVSESSSTGKAWRVPNIKELMSIVDTSANHPAVNTAAFPATPASLRSASPDATDLASDEWTLITDIGRIDVYSASSVRPLRLVR